MKGRSVTLYDTTLRDGAQGEGVSFSGSGKLRFAERMAGFGIPYLEGGYAGSNPKDMEFFRAVQRLDLGATRISAFGSTRRAGVPIRKDRLVASLLEAGTPVVTLVGKSWKLHVTDVLRTTVRENLAMVSDSISHMKEQGREVFFDAEHFFDGYLEDPDFAMGVLDAAVRAGADALILCDTTGGKLPHEIFTIVSTVVAATRVPVGIHCHNDSGLAVANSLEAVRAGALQVQGTINGYGERCGNADLCSILPSLVLKMGHNCVPRGRLAKLRELSLFVADLVNLRSDDKAPYVGQSAFAHKAGAHVNAVSKNPRTFEHVEPESVGNERRNLVSELSGGSNVLLKAIELGGTAAESSKSLPEILAALKAMEGKGYAFESADASFKILVQKILKKHKPFFQLDGYRVIVEKRGADQPCLSEATVKVRVNGEIEQTVAEGDGPVNALDKALRKALMRFYPEIADVALTDFRVRILDPQEATAAKTRVLIESSDGQDDWGTVGVSGNIIEASWEALVDSVEYKIFKEEKRKRGGRRK